MAVLTREGRLPGTGMGRFMKIIPPGGRSSLSGGVSVELRVLSYSQSSIPEGLLLSSTNFIMAATT